MAHFEVGKKVIAIKTHGNKLFVRGEVFELLAIKKADCGCKKHLLDIGKVIPAVHNSGLYTQNCPRCRKYQLTRTDNTAWFSSWSFAPYDDSLSELTAEHILEETTVLT